MVDMIHRSAVISDCGKYRYTLERVLAGGTEQSTPVVWVLCNPSTADGTKDDPTVRKCAGFTANLGYKRFTIINPFAYRATKPKELLAAGCDIVGIDNWKWTLSAISQPGTKIVVGWGQAVPRPLRDMAASHAENIRAVTKRPLYCLGLTDQWMPRHPLMLSYATSLETYCH